FLRLEFVSPVSGEVPVSLDLVPRAPLPTVITLPVPRPRGHRLINNSSLSFLGYRTRGLDVRYLSSGNVTQQEPALLAAFWPEALRPDPATVWFAYSIWSDANKPPVVRLRLDPHPARAPVRQELVVRAGLRPGDVGATAELSAPVGELSFVEWNLSPGLMVTSVTGAEVRHWCQAENGLLVWLEGARDSAKIEWSGWLPVAHDGNESQLTFPRARP